MCRYVHIYITWHMKNSFIFRYSIFQIFQKYIRFYWIQFLCYLFRSFIFYIHKKRKIHDIVLRYKVNTNKFSITWESKYLLWMYCTLDFYSKTRLLRDGNKGVFNLKFTYVDFNRNRNSYLLIFLCCTSLLYFRIRESVLRSICNPYW